MTRTFRSESEPCKIRSCSPWHRPFPPEPPQVGLAFPCSAPSSVLYSGFGADSDSSVSYMPSFEVCPLPGPDCPAAANTEASRFSCMWFPDVLGSSTTWDGAATRAVAASPFAFPS